MGKKKVLELGVSYTELIKKNNLHFLPPAIDIPIQYEQNGE